MKAAAAMTFDLDQFEILNSVFELRYGDTPLIWDKAGSYWSDIMALYPQSKVKRADPSSVSVQLTPEMEGTVGIDKLILIAHIPDRNLESLRKAAQLSVAKLSEALNVTLFTRIGLRTVFEKNFVNREQAEALITDNIWPTPVAKSGNEQRRRRLNIEGAMTDPELGFKWEGKTTGCRVKVGYRETKMDVEFPFEFRRTHKSISEIKRAVVVDVDYYAHGTTPSERVDGADLITVWLKTIRRDFETLFHA